MSNPSIPIELSISRHRDRLRVPGVAHRGLEFRIAFPAARRRCRCSAPLCRAAAKRNTAEEPLQMGHFFAHYPNGVTPLSTHFTLSRTQCRCTIEADLSPRRGNPHLSTTRPSTAARNAPNLAQTATSDLVPSELSPSPYPKEVHIMETITRRALNVFIIRAAARSGVDAQRVIDACADRTKLARVSFEIDGHVCPAAAVYLAEHPTVPPREVGSAEHEVERALLDFATAFDAVTHPTFRGVGSDAFEVVG